MVAGILLRGFVLCAAFLLAIPAAANAQNAAHVAQWKAFFTQVLPLAPNNFESIRGGTQSGRTSDSYYKVTATFDDTLVKECNINSNVYWSLFCEELPAYVGSASRSALVADIDAALPDGFTKKNDSSGDPKWENGDTVILLIDPAYSTDTWGISIGNNP